MEKIVDLSEYEHSFSLKNKIARLIWNICYNLLFRPFSLNFFRSWRNFMLKIFGAKLHNKTNIYSSVKIWAPWNLEMGAYATLGPKVDCYNQGKISIGANTTVSQKAYLCSASLDIADPNHPLILQPIAFEKLYQVEKTTKVFA